MLHELRIYDLRPGAVPVYADLFRFRGLPHVTRHLPMAGYWATDSGALNRVYHLWVYADLAERDACRAGLAADAEWMQGFVPEGFPLILQQQNLILQLEAGSPALDHAVAARKTPRPAAPPATPLFAPGRMTLVDGPGGMADGTRIALWRVVSGDGPGRRLSLHAHGEGDPFVTAEGAARHEVLRAFSFSPLR